LTCLIYRKTPKGSGNHDSLDNGNLTVRDRILGHLASFSANEQDHQVPVGVTQEGIAKAVGIAQRHLIQNIRPMISEGLVVEHSSYALGGKQHRKVYFLTIKGRTAAKWVQAKSPDGRQGKPRGLLENKRENEPLKPTSSIQ